MNHTTIGDIVRGDREVFPPYLYEAYQSTRRRAPMLPLVEVPLTLSELTGPGPAISAITPQDADLTRNAGTGGEAIGQRIIVTGRVLDERGTPVPHTLLEIWQANAAGRYLHKRDQWPGPLDPNFLGMGRCVTNHEGVYRFLTIRPGLRPGGSRSVYVQTRGRDGRSHQARRCTRCSHRVWSLSMTDLHPSHSGAYTSAELMVVAAARALAGVRTVFVGVGQPNLACNLARYTVAPG